MHTILHGRKKSPDVWAFSGPPGAGKTTVRKRIASMCPDTTSVLTLSSSECMLNTAKDSPATYGRIFDVEARMLAGKHLMSRAIVYPLITQMPKILDADLVILDGWNRTPVQVKLLVEIFSWYGISLSFLDLHCSIPTLLERIEERAKIEKRLDDLNPEALENRLEAYEKNHRPVVDMIHRLRLPLAYVDVGYPPESVLFQIIQTTRIGDYIDLSRF